MRTKFYFLVIAVAAVLISLSSCQKDDGPYVIDSEVLETGCDEELKETKLPDGVEGVGLLYESWIMVRLQTRATSEQRIAVSLNASFPNLKKDISVKTMELVQVETSTTFKAGESKKDGYVTVVDSVLVFKQVYEAFSFEYEFVYQVPIYNDGVVKQSMPYYRIEKVESGDPIVGNIVVVNQDGKTFMQRPYQHSVFVYFAGQKYEVKAEFMLKKEVLPDQDYLLSSEVVKEGITWLDGNNQYDSWIDLKQTWSKSGVVEKRKKVTLSLFVEEELMPYSLISDKSILLEGKSVQRDNERTIEGGENFDVKEYQEYFVMKYNYFSIKSFIRRQEATYDDGFVKHQMPTFDPNRNLIVGDYRLEEGRKDVLVDGIAADEYDFFQPFTVSLGEKQIKLEISKVVFVRR